ncbi:XPT1 [Acrasis kona]|uniref:XPT1 n=1 Tax=Acrasis kona TaxID=1008807 RepID=A0AAW2YKB2_9EUKA
MNDKVYIDYNDIHRTCADTAMRIKSSGFVPDLLLAIGGGGYIPARILRTFLKIPIKTVSLELYNDKINRPNDNVVIRQWVKEEDIKGKKILVVDEVDDTRTTLHFCVEELQKFQPASVAVFVIHNKTKEKKRAQHWDNDEVKKDSVHIDHYWSGVNVVPDAWLVYPWDAVDIDQHCKNSSTGIQLMKCM